jgi:alpha-L-rhamnosidase
VYSSRKLAQLGRAIGTTKTVADAERLEAQANITAQAMRNLLVDSETGLFHDGLDGGAENHSAWHSQTSTLWLGVAQSATKPRMLEFLARKRMVGSVYAAYSYLLGLYEVDEDHGKVALEMMTDCDENSWCHMLTVNATSTMEAWSRAEKPNLSWSHPWATAAVTAIVRGFIGLTAVKPAFSSWQLKPQPGNATWAAIRVPSVAGLFDVSFNQTASSFGVAITPPANTIGRVCLPKLGSSSPTLQVGTHTVPGTIQGDYVCASGLAPAKGQSVLHVTRTSAM